MPRFLKRATPADVPVPALVMTTVLSQIVLVVTLFSDDAFNFALDLTSALTLIPFLLAGRLRRPDRPRRTPGPAGGGRPRDGLHRVPPLRRRPEVPPRVLHHLRPGHRPVRQGPPANRADASSPRPELVVLGVSAAGAALGVLALALGWISL
ncbi:amino acid permease [Streptomyces sp. MAI_2237]